MAIFVLHVDRSSDDEDFWEEDQTLAEFTDWFITTFLSQYERSVYIHDAVAEIRIQLPFGAFVDYVIVKEVV